MLYNIHKYTEIQIIQLSYKVDICYKILGLTGSKCYSQITLRPHLFSAQFYQVILYKYFSIYHHFQKMLCFSLEAYGWLSADRKSTGTQWQNMEKQISSFHLSNWHVMFWRDLIIRRWRANCLFIIWRDTINLFDMCFWFYH